MFSIYYGHNYVQPKRITSRGKLRLLLLQLIAFAFLSCGIASCPEAPCSLTQNDFELHLRYLFDPALFCRPSS